MRTRAEFIGHYAVSHRNPTNQVIHLICVPAIFFATLALGWLVPIGRWLPGVSAGWVSWINLGTLGAVPMLLFYARLGLSSLVTATVWVAISFAICVAIQSAGASLSWISAGVWVASWLVQFYGHKVEGAKPSFADDLVFLLIGPLFVQDKLARLLSTGSLEPAPHR